MLNRFKKKPLFKISKIGLISVFFSPSPSQVGDSSDTVLTPLGTPKHSQMSSSASAVKPKKGNVRDLLNQSDLFNLYNMLNSVKVDLLWGRSEEDAATPIVEILPQLVEEPTVVVASAVEKETLTVNQGGNSSSSSTASESTTTKGHTRRPSTVSMISTNSAASTISDSESEISNENDSGIESEGSNQEPSDRSTELAKQFRQHLLGLYTCLEQMTEASNYLTARYQSDVGPV